MFKVVDVLKVLGVVLACTLSFTVQALDLQEAKSSGLVGEQRDGYLGIVTSTPSTDVRELVVRINHERRASYEQIAERNKLERQTVELLAAEKAIQKTESGNYVQADDGSWVKK
jgi:uncharacterized protein YdbL (DUF1318 family)